MSITEGLDEYTYQQSHLGELLRACKKNIQVYGLEGKGQSSNVDTVEKSSMYSQNCPYTPRNEMNGC